MTDKTETTGAPERPVRFEGDVRCVCNTLGHDDFNIARYELGLHHMMCPMNATLYQERFARQFEQEDFSVIAGAIARCFKEKKPTVLTEEEMSRLTPRLREYLRKQKAPNSHIDRILPFKD